MCNKLLEVVCVLTGGLLPHNDWRRNALRLTVQRNVPVPFDAHIRRLHNPSRRHCALNTPMTNSEYKPQSVRCGRCNSFGQQQQMRSNMCKGNMNIQKAGISQPICWSLGMYKYTEAYVCGRVVCMRGVHVSVWV